MIKAVFLDFDGTIFSHKTKKIPDSALKAILDAQANGIKVLLSTGRDIAEIETFDCRGIKFDGYVLDDGQLLLGKNKEIIEANYIEGEDKQKIINLFKSKKIPVMIRNLKVGFMNYIDDNTRAAFIDIDSDLPPVKEYNNEDILIATLVTKDEQERNEMRELFNNLYITWWHEHSADLLPKNTNKATGIIKILKHLNIALEDTLAIGDGENDIEMLKQSKHSVAMGNSIDEVKEIVDYVTTDIDEDGIYNAFKKYNII